MPITPPPPPAIHRPVAAQSSKPSKSAENYAQKQKSTINKQTRKPTDFVSGYYLRRYAKNPPDKSIKRTNRLHKRKQAKMRAKRKKA